MTARLNATVLARIVKMWNTRQLARMEELIEEADSIGCRVDWREHLVELGHSLNAVRTMASAIYRRRYEDKVRAERQLMRAIADGLSDPEPQEQRPSVGRPRKIEPPAPTPVQETVAVPAQSVSCTPFAHLRFASEWRGKIALQGITGAQFGDPPPGRSALDEKRSGVSLRSRHDRRAGQMPKRPTLATTPPRF